MQSAPEIEPVGHGIFIWRHYDAAIKAELFSTGLQTDSGIFLVDPIRLAPETMTDWQGVAGVVVTNENHLRSAVEFAQRFRVPVYSASNPAAEIFDASGLTAVPIQGAATGEIALRWEASGGTIVMGDALINFEPYGFTFLPAKYCSNFKLMRTSLATLLDYSFERILFAHGTPILSRARERLEALLKARR